MSSPLIGAKVLVTNPEAQRLHEAGLQAELNGDYAQAHDAFNDAQQILAGVSPTLDTIVQSAHINRDNGFTYVRAAIADSNPTIFDQALATISHSVEATAPLVSNIDLLQSHVSPKKTRTELLAEHGATVSLLGRAATVKEVMLGIDTRGDDEAAHNARDVYQQPYSQAHDILRSGNNGYYLVSNAMVAARQELLNSRLLQMSVWLGRAATGVVWTALQDPTNLRAAVRTVGSRVRHLRSYQAAIASVTTNP